MKQPDPGDEGRLLALDLGRTNCKIGLFDLSDNLLSDNLPTLVAQDTVPVAERFLASRGLDPAIPPNGYQAFLRFLRETMSEQRTRDVALALPFPLATSIASSGAWTKAGGRSSWTRSWKMEQPRAPVASPC